MIYRAAAVFIVIFWLTMMGLLFRNEWWPGYTALREVPAEHVMKMLLVHGEVSDLNILNEKIHLGHLHIHPQIRKDDNLRVVDFTGYFQVHIPGMDRGNLEWRGKWEMDKMLETKDFKINLTLKRPAIMSVDLHVIPSENRAHYAVTTANSIREERDFTLDAAGIRSVLQQMGLDPTVLEAAQSPGAAKPEIKARQSFLEIRGGRIETFEVSVEQSGQTLLDIHVDQLGRILQVKTLVGYTLAPDDLSPQ